MASAEDVDFSLMEEMIELHRSVNRYGNRKLRLELSKDKEHYYANLKYYGEEYDETIYWKRWYFTEKKEIQKRQQNSGGEKLR